MATNVKTIRGAVEINTQSLDRAVKAMQSLEKTFDNAAKKIAQALKQQESATKRVSETTQKAAQTQSKATRTTNAATEAKKKNLREILAVGRGLSDEIAKLKTSSLTATQKKRKVEELRAATNQYKEVLRKQNRSTEDAVRLEDQLKKAVQKSTQAQNKAKNTIADRNKISQARQLKDKTLGGFGRADLLPRDFGKNISDIERQFKTLNTAIQKHGKDSNEAANAERRFKETITASKERLADFTREEKLHDQVKRRAQKATQTSTKTLDQNAKAIEVLRTKQLAAARAIKQSQISDRDKERALKRLDRAFVGLTRRINEHGASSQRAQKGQQQFNRVLAGFNLQAEKAIRRRPPLNAVLDEMSQSAKIALGPLNGVAARLTALKGLFSRNAAGVGVLIGAFTGLAVATGKMITKAREFEIINSQVKGILAAVGEAAQFTQKELNTLGKELDDISLGGFKEFERAGAVLSIFSGIAKEDFDDILLSAQGLASVIGGDLNTNTRKIGRLLEDPLKNLQSLARAGIQFTRVEKDQLEILLSQLRVREAQNLILRKLAPLQEAAKEEARGFNGVLDGITKEFNTLIEQIITSAKVTETLKKTVEPIRTAIIELTNNQEKLNELVATFASIFKGINKSVVSFVNNLERIVGIIKAISFFLVGGLLVKAVAGLVKLSFGLARGFKAVTKAIRNGERASAKQTKRIGQTLLKTGETVVAAGTLKLAWDGVANSVKEANDKLELFKSQQIGDGLRNDIGAAIVNIEARIEETAKKIKDIPRNLRDNRAGGRVNALNRELESLVRRRDALKEVLAQQKALDDQIAKAKGQKEAQASVGSFVSTVLDARKRILEFVPELNDEFKFDRAIDSAQTLVNLFEAAGKGEAFKQFDENGEVVQQFTKEQTRQIVIQAEQQGISAAKAKEWLQQVKLANPQLERAAKLRKEELRRLEEMIKLQDKFFDGQKKIRDKQSISIAGFFDDPESLLPDTKRIRESIQTTLENVFPENGDLAPQVLTNAVNELSRTENQIQTVQAGITQSLQLQDEFATSAERQRDRANRLAELQDAIRRVAETATDPALAEAAKKTLENLTNAEGINKARSELEKFRDTLSSISDVMQNDFSNAFLSLNENLLTLPQTFKDIEESGIFGENSKLGKGLTAISSIMGSLGGAVKEGFGEASTEYKRFAQVQATIAGALAITQALASGLTPAEKFVNAGLIGAAVGAQIAVIESQSFASGGMVRGPGTGTSDSINARLSNGEFVVNSKAVKSVGTGTLESINRGKAPSGNVNVNVIDQRSGGAPVDVQENVGPDGTKSIQVTVRDVVREELNRGSLDRDFNAIFGLRRRGSR